MSDVTQYMAERLQPCLEGLMLAELHGLACSLSFYPTKA